MQSYNPKEIEPKWQTYWDEHQTYRADLDEAKEKFYALIEFPYPSGAGLHVGHPRPFTAMDVISRKKRMEGKNVLYPIGFDAFGLPTENYAIKTGRPPAEVTAENIANFTRQLKSLGFGFDWSRAVDTTDPAYYKWTQWIFLQLYKHGLAYKKNMPINWCLNCKIGLANEEVVDGKCERCGGPVEKRDKEQWMLAITKYADSLLGGLKDVDYIPMARTQQENWIGRSSGASVKFQVVFDTNDANENANVANDANNDLRSDPRLKGVGSLEVFTTRPDTLFGATYMVVAPEHEIIENLKSKIKNLKDVEVYCNQAKLKSDLERTELQKEKTGVELKGLKAINPATEEEIPIFVADYVLATYGTGAIMAVPAHDERDFEFAETWNRKHETRNNSVIEIRQVVAPHVILTGDCTPREEKETSMKDVVSAIVRNRSTDEYLILNWENKRFGLVGGGIEIGEKPEDAIKRELVEETGYTSFEIVREVIPYLYGHGFKPRKDVNCFDLDKVFLIDIVDTEKQEDNENVAGEHSLEWLPREKVLSRLTLDHHKFIWNWYINDTHCFSDAGIAINSGFLDNLSTEEVKEKMIQWLEGKGIGKRQVNYKLRDWVFSRQRYWGEPIPLVYCEQCATKQEARNMEQENKGMMINPGWIPLPEDQLPLTLPEVEKYQPTDTGESPLAAMEAWVKTTCPQCGGEARRETDTMPNWAGSSWYFLRYMDPKNTEALASKEAMQYWGPIDWYNGGMEHVVLHLLYSRFWNQFLSDIGVVPFKEPYKKRTSHGMILAKGGEKMSKSKGNVVNPDEMVEQFGADALRTYIMFMGPFDQAVEWDINGLIGVRRFLDRVWNVQTKMVEGINDEKQVLQTLHQTIKKVSEDIEEMRFNTAIAKMMELTNAWMKVESISRTAYESLIQLLAPFAPHVSEELWELLGHPESIARAGWPTYDEQYLTIDTVTIAIQVNGKLRGTVDVSIDISEEAVKQLALEQENVVKWLEGKEPKKVIYVTGKLVSIVV